jgi:hypothetical protein
MKGSTLQELAAGLWFIAELSILCIAAQWGPNVLFCVPNSLGVRLPAHPSAHLSACLPACLSVCLQSFSNGRRTLISQLST